MFVSIPTESATIANRKCDLSESKQNKTNPNVSKHSSTCKSTAHVHHRCTFHSRVNSKSSLDDDDDEEEGEEDEEEDEEDEDEDADEEANNESSEEEDNDEDSGEDTDHSEDADVKSCKTKTESAIQLLTCFERKPIETRCKVHFHSNEDNPTGPCDSLMNEMFCCNVCDHIFHTARGLAKHQVRRQHFGCSTCDTVFSSLFTLEQHKEAQGHWSDNDEDGSCSDFFVGGLFTFAAISITV